jgi:hypothetical protein
LAILERSTASTKNAPRGSIADKPVSEACFSDWKRFCFVLREIASGEKGHPLSGLEAQKRAQAILSECGYTWPSSDQMREPIVAPTAVPEGINAQDSVGRQKSPVATKLKSVGKAPSPPARRRSDPPASGHRASAIAGSGRAPAYGPLGWQ